MRIFFEKTNENHHSIWGSDPEPQLASGRSPRWYFRLLFQVCRLFSSTKLSKMYKISLVNVLCLLLLHFCTYFSLQ